MNTSDLDDLSPSIGYRATRILALWFAGRRLHVPSRALPGHPLEDLIGRSAFAALVRDFKACRLLIPTRAAEERCLNLRRIAELFAQGWTVERVAREVDLTPRRVEQIRKELSDLGWLKYAQGFDTTMAHGRGRRVNREVPTFPFSGTGDVTGDPCPPAAKA